MALLDRQVTIWLNWGLDHLLPPALRDNLLVMGPLLRLVLGKQWREFAGFKERALALSAPELEATYKRLAGSHLQRATDLHPASIELVLQRVQGPTVLDVGCGRGYLARRLSKELQVEVVGLDILPPWGSSEKGAPRYCCGRADSLPFADKFFDTVICAHTLEHTVEPQVVIRELRRVTGRRLIIVVPRQRPYRYTFDLHLQFFPYPHTLDLLMGARVATTKVVGGELYYEEDLL
ncbi:MAG: hypothetical protein A2091_05325 [Desulfuromonadales bacterium GWD2_61_12]|nr:MAG: hypothetical protein A2005_02320 [Desulfuromonadales bacterium GWC2_61_20]OGR33918.1 MAG: hypothetical protein A2091_05325 [Desulfuromonadales bacterium GWD2_61_12]HAD03425.1 hypothetical protein [Desulfuromonas sp.]HBT82080.1 hypothetical protein [Desulfuromonas sp.]